MDVIDRQAVRLIEIDDKSARNYRTYNLDDAYDDGFYDAISAVLELPPAEPVIIRCKDCKYFDRHTDILQMHQTDGYCMDWARDSYEDWYCSRAERRTDDCEK